MENFNIQLIKQINKLISSFSEISSLDGMAQLIGKILDELFNVKFSELYLFDKEKDSFSLVFFKGSTEDEKNLATIANKEGYLKKVAFSKSLLYISNQQSVDTDPNTNDEVLDRFGSHLFLPIFVQENVIGILGIHYSETDRFKDEDIEILSTICNLSGMIFSKLQNSNLLNLPIKEDTAFANELHLANLRFKSLISSIQAGIMVEDDQRKVVLVNQHFCNLFSLPVHPDQLIGMSCEEAAEISKFLFMDPESFVSEIEHTLAKRQIVTGVELPMKNGMILERDFIPIEDFQMNNSGILWIYRDITKRRRSEKDLLHQSQLLNGTAQAMNYLLVLQDHDKAIQKALETIGIASGVARVYIFENIEDNSKNISLFSLKYEWSTPSINPQIDNPDFQDVPFAENFPSLYGKLLSGQIVLGTGMDLSKEKPMLPFSEDVRSFVSAPIFVNDKLWGTISFDNCTTCVEWSTNEISTLKALAGSIGGRVSRKIIENELISARQNAENAYKTKSEFLATMSHEIRTPMNGVIGMTSLLMQTQLTYDQRDYAETIRVSGELLLNLLNDILDFSKIESGQMVLEEQSFDLRLAIEEVIDLLSTTANEKRLGLYYEIDPAIPLTIKADLTRLRQILVNLTGNALKFTTIGEVVISVKQIAKNADYSEIEFAVKDTGMGIPAEKVSVLFKPFSQIDASATRKHGGTGLGLAICYNLVKMMNGHIRVKSEIGQGSEFSFTIKTTNQSVDSSEKTLLPELKLLKGKKILLVDENTTGVEILGKLLKELEIDLLTASSGRMCLNILNNNPNIDLIILDNDLADMKPDFLVGSIKSAKAYLDCPILMINYANVKETRSDKLADSIFRINKPIKHSQLITYIQKIFSEKKSSQTHHVIHAPQIQKLNGSFPLNILVAEDNAINQKLITRLFEMLGYNIHIAANGYEAIKAVNNMNIDIIFMDIQMPEMDGIEATKQICAKWGSNKPLIVAMTANALQNDKEKCIEAGMDDYMSKPLTIDQVSTRIEKWSLLCNRSRLDSPNI